jgi:hypothetical protein
MVAVAWNPRYLAYAKAHGHEGDPEGMLEHDREAWPGGCMCGFMLWIQARWSEHGKLYAKEIREAWAGRASFDYQGTFDHMIGVAP